MDVVYFFIICFLFLLFIMYIGVAFSNGFKENEKILYFWLLFLTVLFTVLFYLTIYFYVTIKDKRGPPGPPGEACITN